MLRVSPLFSLMVVFAVASSLADGEPETWITETNLDQFAQNNLATVKEPIRGIVVTHRWCGEVSFAPTSDGSFYPGFGEQGIVVLAPYQNPWCWMNDAAVRFTDAVWLARRHADCLGWRFDGRRFGDQLRDAFVSPRCFGAGELFAA